MLSKDIVNICLWDKEEPTLIHPHVYDVSKRQKDKRLGRPESLMIQKEDIAKVGPFCIWELRLATQESRFWQTYLRSPQAKEDRERYLTSSYTGQIE